MPRFLITLAAASSAREPRRGRRRTQRVAARCAAACALLVCTALRAALGDVAPAAFAGLADVNPNARAAGALAGPTHHCKLGYVAAPAPRPVAPVPIPATGGAFFSTDELDLWRQRLNKGPFLVDGDYAPGSPGDWSRIVRNADTFVSRAEAVLTRNSPPEEFSTHGTLARDAAFRRLMLRRRAPLAPVRDHLLAQVSNPALDFANTLCFRREASGAVDAHFRHAAWLLRLAVTYDYVRGELPDQDRIAIEAFIRRNAYFLAAHTDWGLGRLFPGRLNGDYSMRRDAAALAPGHPDAWLHHRADAAAAPCRAEGPGSGEPRPAHAYVDADGVPGPRLSVLSQYYNNRRAAAALAFGAAGVLLDDPNLVASAKRYFMEWLTFGVWGDGSQGEYARNGEYCIAQQGVIYAALNSQGAALFATVLARQGDLSLARFETRDGLFGTQSARRPKSIALVVRTHFELMTGRLDWYRDDGRASNRPDRDDRLGNARLRYLGRGAPVDDYHELGLLVAAALIPQVPIGGWVLRDPRVTALPFPGGRGGGVSSGYLPWSDAFNALPAVLLLRP